MEIKAGHILAASAVLFFCGFAFAGEGESVTLALNTQARPAAAPVAALTPAATAQMQTEAAPCLEGCDFDALSEVNDPLFREGSKQLLEQAAKDDAVKNDAAKAAAKEPAKPVLRDAPNSKPASPAKSAVPAVKGTPAVHPAIKKPAVKEQGPADPVRTSDVL